ncbi:hypothetical protein HDU88_005605 [Geranomyces variabilis]|nr:hypothetical protein HDU88_005605 [Geranomyces variabilis]
MDANAFPTPVEAAELGLNPAPAPLHTGLSDMPDLEEMTGETPQKLADAYHHQLREHHEQQVFCTPAAAPTAPSYSSHSSDQASRGITTSTAAVAEKPTATATSGKTSAARQPPTVRDAYKDGVAQGETLVGAVLETAYGIAQTGVGVIQKITDKVSHIGEGGQR